MTDSIDTLGLQFQLRLWQLQRFVQSNSQYASLNMGTKPTDNPGDYPALEEVTAAFGEALQRVTSAAETLTAETLFAPPAQDTGGWVTDRYDALVKAAWHNGWHVGQLSSLRKAMGMPAMFGS